MATKTGKSSRQKRPVAVIDIGSTSVRMRIAEAEGKSWKVIEDLVQPASLGADTFRHGVVQSQTLRAISGILKNFAQVLREFDVGQTYVVATSAIREASNQELVVDRIRHETGFHVDILDSVEESRITYHSLLPFLKTNQLSAKAHTLVLDLGGGSTETMVLKGRNLVTAGSRQLGTARLSLMLSESACGDAQSLMDSMINTVVQSTLDLYLEYPIRNLIVINSVLLRALSKEKGVRQLNGGIAIPTSAINDAVRDASLVPMEELTTRFPIRVLDTDLLLPSLLVLHESAQYLEVDEVVLPDIEMLQGLLAEIKIKSRGEDPFLAFREQVVRSTRGIMDKFRADIPHAMQVTNHALDIFDAVQKFFDLNDTDRLLLELAGLLHDIGMYISAPSHHKHSAYLIEWAEIAGLNSENRKLVATIARYHRNTAPRAQHIPYANFTPEQRLRISKLAAILRVADALDRSHWQRIKKLIPHLTDRTLELVAVADGDLMAEQSAIQEKGDLFRDISGLDITLRRQVQ